MKDNTKEMTDGEVEKMQLWVRERFQECNKYLAAKGILTEKVLLDESRYLAPMMAVWKVKTRDRQLLWVITGNLPADHVAATVAAAPRDVLRHFSMGWQLKAETILSSGQRDPVQQKFAALLIQRAEELYQLYNSDQYWTAVS